jgi:hypothetical protein
MIQNSQACVEIYVSGYYGDSNSTITKLEDGKGKGR